MSRDWYIYRSNFQLRKYSDQDLLKVALAVVGHCRENVGSLPEYTDAAPFEMTLDSILSDFDLELISYSANGILRLATTTDAIGDYGLFEDVLKLIAPLLKDGSFVIVQDADDSDNLIELTLVKGRWMFRSNWNPRFYGSKSLV